MTKKTAVVTGAAKRIGAAIAISLAKRGYDIILHYHKSEKEAFLTKDIIFETGQHCELVSVDLSNQKTLEAFAQNYLHNTSLLVNNASLYYGGEIHQDDTHTLDTMFSIHLKAPYYLIHFLAKNKRPAHVINMLDAQLNSHWGRYIAYALSKNTLANLTKIAAKQLAPTIRVNGIAPGHILHPDKQNLAFDDYIYSCEGIIKALHYLLDNQDVTGEILTVDRGNND